MKAKNFFTLISFLLIYHYSFSQEAPTPQDTEVWEPVPPVIAPSDYGLPPSDAIVLFDGRNTDEWLSKDGSEVKWNIENGILTIAPSTGDIITKRSFGDCQLHIEWRAPAEVIGDGQGRGNSGVFLMDNYEIQILDNYDNLTYTNGQAGSVYKQHIPLVNACRPPGQWQIYDIIFSAPKFDEGGDLLKPAYVTVLHNGVLIQNHVEIKGPTTHRGWPEYKAHAPKMPIRLQDHNDLVSFRNIWIREL